MKFIPPPEKEDEYTQEFQKLEALKAKELYDKIVQDNEISLTMAYAIGMSFLVDTVIEMPNDASRFKTLHTVRDTLMEGVLMESLKRLRVNENKDQVGIQ